MEIWQDIKEYEGLYQVSNLGRIRSLDRWIVNTNYKYFKKGKVIKQEKSRNGYLRVSLCKNNKHIKFLVHRLVAIEFIDNPNNFLQVNHIDGNKENNNVNNLEWTTQAYNMSHAYNTGLEKKEGKKVMCVTTGIIYESIREAERATGASHVGDCCKGKRNYAGITKDGDKMVWKYVKE